MLKLKAPCQMTYDILALGLIKGGRTLDEFNGWNRSECDPIRHGEQLR
jgi:hypothetical protein